MTWNLDVLTISQISIYLFLLSNDIIFHIIEVLHINAIKLAATVYLLCQVSLILVRAQSVLLDVPIGVDQLILSVDVLVDDAKV